MATKLDTQSTEHLSSSLVTLNQSGTLMNQAALSSTDYATLWTQILADLRLELGDDVYESWFKRLKLDQADETIITLSVPTRFLKQWIEGHYFDRILTLWRGHVPTLKRIELRVRADAVGRAVAPKSKTVMSGPDTTTQPLRPNLSTGVLMHAVNDEDNLKSSPLDPRLTFESFVPGVSNRFAYSAAQEAASGRITYNPLFVHGNVGLGKSHLLQASVLSARAKGRKALYLTAERFMFGFVSSLQKRTALAFKEALRDIDLMVIDDVQFLQGKSVQEEFGHMIDALTDANKQIIIAANVAPVHLNNLEERVRSRLGCGLCVEIGGFDFEVRRAILGRRAATLQVSDSNLTIPDAVLDRIARLIDSNGRDLEGAFNRVVAQNRLTGAPISLDMVNDAIRDLLKPRGEASRVKIEDIQRVVARTYNISRQDLLSARRTRTIVRPRQIAMYLAKTMTLRSLPEIGRRFGNRDHTTVLHAVRKIEKSVENDNSLRDEIDTLKNELGI